jgi:acetylglutamate kinase
MTGHTSPSESRTRIAATMGKARILSEAMPFIRRFSGATVVIKYGGSAMVDDALADSFAADITLLSLVGLRPVVVHGGGPQISAAMERAGVVPQWVDGLRVTDAATIAVVQEVLAGTVNPSIVRRMVGQGAKAIGMTGIDGGLLTAEARDPKLGFVGKVTAVDTDLVDGLVGQGVVPVIAPLALGADGAVYNLNADTAAAAIARSLHAHKLVYLTDVEGLYADPARPDTFISRLTVEAARDLLPSIGGGMRPKVESCVAAIDGGVRQAHILDGRVQHAVLLEIFTPEGIGTMIDPSVSESIHAG